jgi:hypothetical protein
MDWQTLVGGHVARTGTHTAVYDNYIDRLATQCVNTLTPTWSTRLAAFDVALWVQCYAMSRVCGLTSKRHLGPISPPSLRRY